MILKKFFNVFISFIFCDGTNSLSQSPFWKNYNKDANHYIK